MTLKEGMNLLVAFIYSTHISKCHTLGALQGPGSKMNMVLPRESFQATEGDTDPYTHCYDSGDLVNF